jgi:PTS system mannose-specific IID component
VNGVRDVLGMSDLLSVFWRAFLIQASWSYDRMQTLGFAYALEPALRKLYPDRTEYEARLRVHLEYFNTQPYFASFILGAAARLEQDRATGGNRDADVAGLKAALMAPLGALGDSFFWGALRPFASVLSVAVLVTGGWWAPLLFFALYNSWHVGLRLWLLFLGYASGGDAVALMARVRFTKIARRLKVVSLILLGSIPGMMLLWRPEFKPVWSVPIPVSITAGLSFMIVSVSVARRGVSPVKLMLGLAAVCLALAYAGVVL